MTEVFVQLEQGDCVELMAEMPEASVDAIVTDPPYGLEFMGKEWDKLGATTEAAGDSPGWRAGHGGSGVASKTNGVPFGGGGQRVRYGDSAKSMQAWHEAWAREALRVLKPGGHLLAFGGTRTYHRLACAIEDAGFEIRDCIQWLYGSGFPKSLDVSKAIDKAAGAKREVVGTKRGVGGENLNDIVRGSEVRQTDEPGAAGVGAYGTGAKQTAVDVPVTVPTTPEAKQWSGWGTALKPANEPIVVARKPLIGTVAKNVLAHGTGALNIDGCRVASTDEIHVPQSDPAKRAGVVGTDLGISGAAVEDFQRAQRESVERANSLGRWPANVILSHAPECRPIGVATVPGRTINRWDDGAKPFGNGAGHPFTSERMKDDVVERWECVEGCAVRALDAQSGVMKDGVAVNRNRPTKTHSGNTIYGDRNVDPTGDHTYGGKGGASRFFYCAKAAKKERNAGLDGFDAGQGSFRNAKGRPMNPICSTTGKRVQDCDCMPTCRWEPPVESSRNTHPTVKPISLMRYLIKLVTPPDGLILDPFMGSGTTGCAAALEGVAFIGLELNAEYIDIAQARIAHWQQAA